MKASGYAVRVDRVRVGAQQFSIRALADLNQFHDPEGIAEALGISSAQWPLFGRLWPSGRVLAEAMADLPLERADGHGAKRFLELGCGLGLASIVAHERGGFVTASDLHPLAGAFLLANTALNHLAPIAFQHNDWSGTTAMPGVFDVIMGSDLLYEERHPDALAACVARHGHIGTEVLIVDPGRGHGPRFRRALEAYGYEGDSTPVSPRSYAGIAYRGAMFRYRRLT